MGADADPRVGEIQFTHARRKPKEDSVHVVGTIARNKTTWYPTKIIRYHYLLGKNKFGCVTMNVKNVKNLIIKTE